ncbi:MAG: hypothetical protein HY042_04310, partial [Spirochaetia bacterium]|nr:hypothetical protein [Spirochaetia bacterium]
MGWRILLERARTAGPKGVVMGLAGAAVVTISTLAPSLSARPFKTTALPDPYYPQKPTGELRLNYYYDRTGRWVKFSDWIPFKQRKWEPRYFEDFYRLYGLPPGYNAPQIKESMFYLYMSLGTRFRHPASALCKIKTEDEHHRYRNLMFMHTNLLIMRMYLRLGSMYDKRHLYYHDLDVADEMSVAVLDHIASG